MAHLHLLCLMIIALLALGATGCSAGESATAAPTRAEFMKRAEAICERTDEAQKAAIEDFRKKFPKADSSISWEERLIVTAGLPPIQTEAEELGDLPVPSGDEEEMKAIVESMEEAVDEARKSPSSMLEKDSVGPFTEVFKLAKEYGFKACATPI
jgi:hypothetical protein